MGPSIARAGGPHLLVAGGASATPWLARTHDGLAIAFAFISQPADAGGFLDAAIPAVQRAASSVTARPDDALLVTSG